MRAWRSQETSLQQVCAGQDLPSGPATKVLPLGRVEKESGGLLLEGAADQSSGAFYSPYPEPSCHRGSKGIWVRPEVSRCLQALASLQLLSQKSAICSPA